MYGIEVYANYDQGKRQPVDRERITAALVAAKISPRWESDNNDQVYVDADEVGGAVEIINSLGYATDEDNVDYEAAEAAGPSPDDPEMDPRIKVLLNIATPEEKAAVDAENRRRAINGALATIEHIAELMIGCEKQSSRENYADSIKANVDTIRRNL